MARPTRVSRSVGHTFYMATNTGIYLEKNGQLSVRKIEEAYVPAGYQSLVQVEYSAINPADLRHFFMGASEFIAGYEWTGTVVSAGSASPFKAGQKLFGMSSVENNRPLSAGSHQDYMLADPEWTWQLPKDMNPLTAVTLPYGAFTAIDALFNCLGFGFPRAGVSGNDPDGQAILIWGGSSAQGQAGIQLAKLAGFSPIVTTASKQNHTLLKELGATNCFDYRSSTVVEEIRTAVQATGKKLKVVYDPVATGLGFAEDITAEEKAKIDEKFEQSSPAMAKRCCDDENDLKLCASLIVEKDPIWTFPFPYQLPAAGLRQAEGGPDGVESLLGTSTRERGDRHREIVRWLLENHADHWKPIQARIIHGGRAGIEAIRDVFEGKAGGRKIVIDRPL